MACPWCSQGLAWLSNWPEFEAAFGETDGRRVVLELTLQQGAESNTLRKDLPAELTLTDIHGEAWKMEAGMDFKLLQIEHAARMSELAMPMRDHRIDGATLSARLLLESANAAASPQICQFLAEELRLESTGRFLIGRAAGGDAVDILSVPDPQIARRHCLIVKECQDSFWIVDLGSETGTFLNGQMVLSAQLSPSDVVQLGNYGWTFNAEDRFLVPMEPIAGSEIVGQDLSVSGRMEATSFEIASGEFVAIVGPSGAGKSTLLKAILSVPGFCDQGSVTIGGIDCRSDRDGYRRQLGYVSQKEVLHEELSVMEALQFAGQLRGTNVSREQLRQLLRRLDVPKRCRNQRVGSLSGGELKRVRLAAELAARPKCLLLDEPTSGLDPQREREMMRLLRGLSIQGCTIVIITHGLDHIDCVDRVLAIRQGSIAFDGPLAELKAKSSNEELTGVVVTETRSATTKTFPVPVRPKTGRYSQPYRPIEKNFQQFARLAQREMQRLLGAWQSRLLVPLLMMPMVFAMALHIATPPNHRHMLGFLAILSCIWMGGSLSLTSIVGEQNVVDHERLLFLNFVPYVLSKAIVLWLLASLQTTIFVCILHGLRSLLEHEAILYGMFPWGWVSFLFISWAAVSLGLIISAAAKWAGRVEVAHFVFPLVMMCQMVLSVQVAGEGDGDLQPAYANFSWQRTDGGELAGTPDETPRTRQLCIAGSYFTITRYGDLMLRSFAYHQKDHSQFQAAMPGNANTTWWRCAAASLAAMLISGPLASALLLRAAEWEAKS